MSRVGAERPELVLASSSPRRLEILRTVGVEPTVVNADVDERARSGESPAELVARLALAKAQAVAARLGAASGPRLVIGADTVIDLDGRILGKPSDRSEAGAMLGSLRGRTHGVITGVAVVASGPALATPPTSPSGGESVSATGGESVAVERTEVAMRPFGPDELTWYLDSSEFEGKAGAYAIQGLGSLLVSGIDGSYHAVVGLPLTVVDRLLAGLGWPLREFMTTSAATEGDAKVRVRAGGGG